MRVRFFINGSDLITHVYGYKNHMILDNTIIIENVYISDNIAGSWLSPISIGSIGKKLLL